MTLTEGCYNNMFYDCHYLTQAPELPATTSNSASYYYMFVNCWSLGDIPKLAASPNGSYCYYGMFQSCSLGGMTFHDKTFDEMVDLIQNECILGDSIWYVWGNDGATDMNPVWINCIDKTMYVVFDSENWTWIINEW